MTRFEDQLRGLWDVEPHAAEARAVALAAFGASRTQRTRRRRRLVVAAGVLAMATAGGGATAAAAQGALPGDPAYGVKLTLERARVALARGDEAEAEAWLRVAQARLEEAVRTGSEGRYELMPDVMAGYRSAVAETRRELAHLPADDAVVVEAEATLQAHQEVLAGLVDVVPGPARAALELALRSASRSGRPDQVPPLTRVPPAPPIERAPEGRPAPGAPPTGRSGDDGPAAPRPDGPRGGGGADLPGSSSGQPGAESRPEDATDDRPAPPAPSPTSKASPPAPAANPPDPKPDDDPYP